MEVMAWIINNWNALLMVVLVIAGVISLFVGDKKRAMEWLLKAELDAEKEFGGKTGTLKLRTVYDLFITKFPVLSRLLSFNEFSKMVDIVLEKMRHLIDTNMAVYNYVYGDKKLEE